MGGSCVANIHSAAPVTVPGPLPASSHSGRVRKLAICSSIHAFAWALISSEDSPRVSIPGPITSRMVPGNLRKLRRDQKSPASCAIGVTVTPVRLASTAPPFWKGRVIPGATRVPSGSTTIQLPASSRSRPCAMSCFTASRPAVRSIAMGRSKRSPQPKEGTRSNSR